MFPEDSPEKTGEPFFLVRRITGGDDKITDCPVVSIHTFHTDMESAEDAAFQCHDLMLALNAKTVVNVESGSFNVDLCETVESPKWVDYENDNLERYVARYRLYLRLDTGTTF